MLAHLFSMLMRAQGVSGADPQPTGTAIHLPSDTARYSYARPSLPYLAMNDFMMSSIGSSLSAYWCTVHMSNA